MPAEGGHVRVGQLALHGCSAAPGRKDSEYPLTPPLLLRGAMDAEGRSRATLRHFDGDVQLAPEAAQGRPVLRKEARAKMRRRLRVEPLTPLAATAAPERPRALATLDVAHDPCVDRSATGAPAVRHREHPARGEERQSLAGWLDAAAPRAAHQAMPGATAAQQKGSSQGVPETLKPRVPRRRNQRLWPAHGLVGVSSVGP